MTIAILSQIFFGGSGDAHTSARDAPASTRSSPHGISTPRWRVLTSSSRSSQPSPSSTPRAPRAITITPPRLLTPRRIRPGPAPPSAPPTQTPTCVHPPRPSIPAISRENPSVSTDPPALDPRRRPVGRTSRVAYVISVSDNADANDRTPFSTAARAASLRRRQVRREGAVQDLRADPDRHHGR